MKTRNNSENLISQKTDFLPFRVGEIFNPLKRKYIGLKRKYSQITLKYPTRLEAMALDPSQITINKNMIYKAGQINFTVCIFKIVIVKVRNDTNEILITKRSPRKTLIKHAVALMKDVFGFKHGLEIDVEDNINMRHCGLGSSSGLISSIAVAINELYENAMDRQILARYLTQNHGEEIDSSQDMLMPVQALGGSVSCGTHIGGMIVLAGESVIIKTMDISDEYDVIIGIPNQFKHPDSKELMANEENNFARFLKTGKQYSREVAYRLIHECFPAIEDKRLDIIGDLIFDYRYNMGSIKNCSFVYPPIVEIANKLKFLKEKGHADILSMSSVGPGMFVITKHPDICEKTFKKVGMKILKTKIYNGKYEILNIA